MTTLKFSRGAVLLGGAAAAALMCSGASAQTAPTTLDEVVVTALRREQRLQDVPAAVAVLSADDIKAKGAQDLRDYLTTLPGVTYAENNVGGMRVTIRGISDGIGATDPLTGIYIDEAPVTESAAATLDPDIYDVDRVEVLKGPQGTLYGAGSMGGTVRIISKKPILDRFEGAVEGTLASIDHGSVDRRVDGVVNVPILQDRMALRVSAGYRKDGGWIDDVAHNDKDANTIEKKNVHAQLLLKPAERTSVILGFLYQKEDDGLPPFDDLALPDYQSGKIFRQTRNSEAKLFSLTILQDWDGMSLTSASNYLKKDSNATFDVTTGQRALLSRLAHVTIGAKEGIGLRVPISTHQFTQEVRLASTGHQRLGWLVGGFYSDASTDDLQTFDLTQAPSLTRVITGEQYYTSLERTDTRQIAAFGELTFNVTDKLSLTGGVRAFDVRQQNFTQTGGILNDGDSVTDDRANLSSSTKKVVVQYQASRDHMLYAQAVQGYRNGGPNSDVPLATCGDALAAAGYQGAPRSFGPDKLWNYEIGAKNTLFDGRAQINAAAFYIDWSGMQSTVGLSCGLGFVTNAGKAVSKGLEVEGSARPLDGLTVNFSASVIDAKLTSVAPGVVGTKGDPLPLTAKWSWNVNALYEHELSNDLTGFVRGEVNYVGKRWNNFRTVGVRARLMDDYTTVNARFGVRTDRWSLAVFATNLTDERYVLNVNYPSYELVGRPRTIGVNARVGF